MKFVLQRKTDLALRALRELEKAEGSLQSQELAELIESTANFLPQVMTSLVRNEWVSSSRGPTGGYRLEASLTDFGMFVGVEEGLDGLVHISEMSWNDRAKDAAAEYSVGDDVEVIVVDIKPEDQRLGLSIKQLAEDPWVVLSKKFPIGTKVKAKVVRLVDFGAFLEIACRC